VSITLRSGSIPILGKVGIRNKGLKSDVKTRTLQKPKSAAPAKESVKFSGGVVEMLAARVISSVT
jgi:hypothetical protein